MAQLYQTDNYHVKLTDGSSTIGLKICDERGNVNPKAFQISSNPRTAMRVSQAASGYADFEMPYTPITITDWTGGRGQEDHENDTTRFYDSNNVHPTFDGLILGPAPTTCSLAGLTGVSGKTFGAVFFTYFDALFCVTQPDDDSGSKLYVNGWLGKVRADRTNATTILTSLNLAGINLAGKIFKFCTYPGVQQDPNYAVIASNTQTGTNDTITLESPGFTRWWDTRANFVVEGDGVWNEISTSDGTPGDGHSLFHGTTIPDAVTSVAVFNGIAYFARGSILPLWRGKYDPTTGAWSWAVDSSYSGTVLQVIHGQDGKPKLWSCRTSDNTVKHADPVDWGTDLTWTDVNDGKAVGMTNARITNMIAYDEPVKPWIFKADEFGSINNDVYAAIPLGEYRSVSSENNGRHAIQLGVYLYFSLMRGKIQRFYNGNLDDVGPDWGVGLPAERQGPVSGIAGYPGRYFAAFDPGPYQFSTIMMSRRDRWFEYYRATQPNQYGNESSKGRIRGLYIQSIPGSSISRLWFAEGDHLVWLPISDNPLAQSNYVYNTDSVSSAGYGGHLITSWIYGQFKDVPKFWKSLKLFVELPTGTSVTAEYQVDNQTSWTALPSGFTTSPVTEVDLSATNNVVGKRIRFRLWLKKAGALTSTVTPRIKAAVIEAVTRLPVKRIYTFSFLAEDYYAAGRHFDGQEGAASTLLGILEGWADVNTRTHPVTMTSIFPNVVDKPVFIDPPDIRPLEIRNDLSGTFETRMVGRISILQA